MDLLSRLIDGNNNSHQISLREWLRKAQITINGRPYSTSGHEYLEQLLDDTHPDTVYRKGSQIGASTLLLYKALWVADAMGKNVVFYSYNDLATQDFCNGRVQPAIENSDYLAGRMGQIDNARVKQLGNGILYLRGLNIKGQVKSIACDFMIADEIEEADPENIEWATDRLLHSDLGWSAYLSVPSMPMEGIDAQFSETDQQFYTFVCDNCKHVNIMELEFPANFIPLSDKQKRLNPKKTHYRGCSQCHKPLDMSKGIWRALYPGRTLRRGYHISQLYAQRNHPKYPNWASFIMDKYESSLNSTAKAENFNISYLGLPYSGAGARITDEVLSDCHGNHGFCLKGTACFMGVDQGDKLHVCIGQLIQDRLHVIYCEETEDWRRIPQLIEQFGISIACIDAMPNKLPAKEIAGQYRNRVYIQYFQKEFRTSTEVYLGKYTINTVNVNRTESLDATVDALENQNIILPRPAQVQAQYLPIYGQFKSQLKELKSVVKIDKRGTSRKEYIGGRNVQNHFGMALNSMRIAALELGGRAPSTTIMPMFIEW